MLTFSVDQVRFLADVMGWTEIEVGDPKCLSFKNSTNERINVYFTTGTVATALKHPTKGKTQLYRRNVGFTQLRKIFNDPRCHTGKGYYKK